MFASDWPSLSIPGKDIAIFLNKLFTLCPAFADVSMNIMFNCCAFAVASSSVTCLAWRKPSGATRMLGHIPLVGKVGLVAHKDDNHVVPSL